jgi:hypothetical protein
VPVPGRTARSPTANLEESGFEAKSMQWAALMSRPVSPAPSGDITFDDLS